MNLGGISGNLDTLYSYHYWSVWTHRGHGSIEAYFYDASGMSLSLFTYLPTHLHCVLSCFPLFFFFFFFLNHSSSFSLSSSSCP